MNTSSITIIVGIAIASFGITYVLISENNKPLPPKPQEMEVTATSKSSTAPTVKTPSIPQPKTGSKPKISESQKTSRTHSSFPKPDGISDKVWKKSVGLTKLYRSQIKRTLESKWVDQYGKEIAKQDLQTITEKLGLESSQSAKIEALLSTRMEASTESINQAYKALLSSEEGFTTLVAIDQTSKDGTTIPSDLLALKETYQKEMFGEFYGNKDSLSDEDVIGLLRPTRPERWYKDDEFLITASSELGENQASSLVEYAGKMDYLDRKEDASEKINRIERSVDLQPQQASALEKLYIDTPSPTDEQLSIIVGADKVEALKSSTSRRGRDRGRGGRR